MDRFFTQKHCDRCGGSLDGGRTMSMFNEDCICMECSKKNAKGKITAKRLKQTTSKSDKAITISKA